MALRVARLEAALAALLERRLTGEVVPSLQAQIQTAAGSWFWPLLALAGLVVGALAVGWNRYRYLIKRHVL